MNNLLQYLSFNMQKTLYLLVPGMCYAYGRGHYRTFDGKNYYFYGTCKYQMVYVKDPLIKFSVVLINDPNCDINADCKKGVEVVMEDANVFLGTTTTESGMPYVTINGIQESIPYKKRTPSIRVVSIDFSFVVFLIETTGPLEGYKPL
jgi:hypothetical protein